MARISILFAAFLFSQITFANDPIKTSPVIREVTVYPSGAKLSSVATVFLPAGQSEVIFENITPHFNPASLQVKMGGSALLNSAVFRLKNPSPEPENPRIKKVQDSILLIGDRQHSFQLEKNILEEEARILQNNLPRVGAAGAEGSQNPVITIQDLKNLTEYYRQRMLDIRNRQQTIGIEERKLTEEKNRLHQTLQLIQPKYGATTGEIVLKIEAPVSESVEITCAYLTTQASWTPLYDLRAGESGDAMQLTYRANIKNLSGFDWKRVKLLLSTAKPLYNNERPILNSLFADFRPVYAYQYNNINNVVLGQLAGAQSVDGGNIKQKGARDNATNYYIDGMRVSKDAIPSVQDIEQLQIGTEALVEDGAGGDVVAIFEISKLQDIAANGEEYTVTVSKQDVPATYEYHTVPKLAPAVYLLAKVTDYGKYNLMTGLANIFYDDNFVGQTTINPQIAADTLVISLGREERIAVKRERPKDFKKERKFLNNDVKDYYKYEIILKNNKNTPITVNVLDQIPISKNNDIEVKLEDGGQAKYDDGLGKLEWDVTIPAGKSKVLSFEFCVKYPKNKPIQFAGQ